MADRAPVRVFVAPRGNAFMTDIASWIVEAAGEVGRDAALVSDRLPADDGGVNLVVAPHEFFLLADADDRALRAAAAASVPVCTEQPGTPWYRLGLEYCRLSRLAVDINPHGVTALQRDGLPAVHLRLGGVDGMDRRGVTRDIDLLFLGGDTPRRGALLASLAPLLWSRRCQIRLFRFSAPVDGQVPGLVFGTAKYDLLARSRILLNLHRDDALPAYFEWARMVEAMANGCAVVSEPSTGCEPLAPGVHFVETDDLVATVAHLLDDPERCAAVGEAAADAVLREHRLAPALASVLDAVESAPPRRVRRRGPLPRGHTPPLLPVWRPHRPLRERVYLALLAEQTLQRQIDRARCRVRFGTDERVEYWQSAAYPDARPEVSVVLTLYGYAHLVGDTLASVVASTDVDLELVVVDDHSIDGGREVVKGFGEAHPDVPLLLVGSDVNRGLPASRNLGFAHARAAKVMVMDADNLVYPTCLRRLADALDGDPGAAFAYATLADFGESTGVRSAMGWHVPWLCEANYIDAQAMVRREVWERHGGYRADDPLTFGWEDWDLWLRLAEAGERGVHVPEMLGRYRTQTSSMITITNLAEARMRAHLAELHPQLPWPLDVVGR